MLDWGHGGRGGIGPTCNGDEPLAAGFRRCEDACVDGRNVPDIHPPSSPSSACFAVLGVEGAQEDLIRVAYVAVVNIRLSGSILLFQRTTKPKRMEWPTSSSSVISSAP